MKSGKVLINVLLSMLFLVIAMYPCTDVYVPVESTTHKTLVQENRGVDHSILDDCSPLCACMCCAAPITVALTVHLPNAPFSNLKKQTPLPYDNLIQGAEKPIWQPPKIV